MVHPPFTPYVFYEDAASAIAYLSKAFGFRERFPASTNDDGRVVHAELELGDVVVMLADGDASDHLTGRYRAPNGLGGVTVGLHVHVDDVDTHFASAKAAGAIIEHEPQDQTFGARYYRARDPEGHVWWFWSPTPS